MNNNIFLSELQNEMIKARKRFIKTRLRSDLVRFRETIRYADANKNAAHTAHPDMYPEEHIVRFNKMLALYKECL
jgi:hypothetical protein